jgi:hypothetical protein
MNRRDFLLFKTVGERRVAELSCERLYMRVVDTRRVSAAGGDAGDRWDGEPPAVFDGLTTDRLFADLEQELGGADVVRVADLSWLGASDLKSRLEAVLEAVRSRGVRVECL